MSRTRLVWVAALLAAALPSSSPAGSTAGPTAEYAREVTTAQLRQAALEALLVETQGRVTRIEETLQAQGQSEASRAESVESLSAELAALRGRVEVVEHELTAQKEELAALQISTERRLLHLEMRARQVETMLGVKPPPPPTDADLGLVTAGGGAGTATPAPVPAPAPAPEPVAELPKDAGGRLDLGVEHMRAGRQVAARAVFKQAIDENVGAPELDEIRYRYAETFFNTGEYAKAVQGFQAVIANHAKSDWACWSYYRQGEAMDKLGKDGKPFYQGATEGSCAKSAAAKEAKKKL